LYRSHDPAGEGGSAMGLFTMQGGTPYAWNIILRIALMQPKAQNPGPLHEKLQSLQRSTRVGCASEPDAAVLLQGVQKSSRAQTGGAAPS
jgi:hypothetical protein